MTKRMLADVLWDAANKHLASVDYHDDSPEYSCESVAMAARANWDSYSDWKVFIAEHPAIEFLRSLGCAPERDGQFGEFQYGEQRQGVRYMWLLLAMHVAEDEGITL